MSQDHVEPRAPGPDDAGSTCNDFRVVLEIGPGIEWLCEPEVLGWRTTAAGYDGPIDFPVLPP